MVGAKSFLRDGLEREREEAKEERTQTKIEGESASQEMIDWYYCIINIY